MNKKIFCLNIRHGGGTPSRCSGILAHIEAASADIVILTEFRDNAIGQLIKNKLLDWCYNVTHPNIDSKSNTVLIASKCPITCAGPLSNRPESAKRLWVVDVGWLRLCGVYMALGRDKKYFWDEIIGATAAHQEIDLFIGDFNTGSNTFDRGEGTTRFAMPEYIDKIQTAGYIDAWRNIHGAKREYTWISPRGGEFRLDFAFLRHKRFDVLACEHIHATRESLSSDHSALMLELRSIVGSE
jgi:exodeoxyribonuclease-3